LTIGGIMLALGVLLLLWAGAALPHEGRVGNFATLGGPGGEVVPMI
jgi:hypothetical protein